MSNEQNKSTTHDSPQCSFFNANDDIKISSDEKDSKCRSIIRKEFDDELANKAKTLGVIDERLLLARKTFQKLRYAIVNNFYNSKKLTLTEDDIKREVYQQKNSDAKSEIHTLLTNEQKRIHPAIKSILADKLDPTVNDLPIIRPRRKKIKLETPKKTNILNTTIPVDSNINTLRPHIKSEFITESYDGDSIEDSKNVNKSINEENSNPKMTIPMYVGPKGLDQHVLKIDALGRNKRKKIFRIIIGNTSKFIEPGTKDDPITHKWLLYIRGPPTSPDISHIVESITVQLHDSYAPHNVIKLKSHPLHLTKRGWGEFPVKLKLHFKNGMFNKPVTIIHNLKLDRYHTGLQTLGGETVADVWLTTDESMIDKNENSERFDNPNAESKTNSVENPSSYHNIANYNIHSTVAQKKLNTAQIKSENNISDDENDDVYIISNDPNNSRTIQSINEPLFDGNIKIKEEPMEIDDEQYFETIESYHNDDHLSYNSNISHDNLNPNGYKFYDKNISPYDSANLMLKIKPEYNEAINIDLNSSDYLKNILKTIYSDHSYSQNVEMLENFNSLVGKSLQPCDLLEMNIFNDLKNLVELDELMKWFKLFDLEDVIDDNEHLDVNLIMKLIKIMVDRIIKCDISVEISEAIDINCIENINRMIISHFLKALSSMFHCKNRIPIKTVKNNLEILRNAILTNDLILNNIICFKLIKSKSASFSNNIIENNNKLLAGKKILEIIEMFTRVLPNIKDIRCAVNMMLKKIPLIEELAYTNEYKYFFPFAVENADKYFELNVIKRRNILWTRAKTINNLLKNYFVPQFRINQIWSTRQILTFSQYHGYFPVKSNIYDIPLKESDDYAQQIKLKEAFKNVSQINTKIVFDVFAADRLEKIKIENNAQNSIQDSYKKNIQLENEFFYISDSSDDEVDIISVNQKRNNDDEHNVANCHKGGGGEILPFETDDEKLQCQYIEKVCSGLGIELRNQNIGNGYVHGVVHKIILTAVKCFAEDILRRTLSVKIEAMKSAGIESVGVKQNLNETNIPSTSSSNVNKTSSENSASSNLPQTGVWNISENGSKYDVSIRHVFEALKSRQEFDFLTNFGLGLEESDFKGEL